VREGKRSGRTSERSMCNRVVSHTAPAFSLLSLSLSLFLCCYLYIAARGPCADYIDHERNIDPSQRRRALTAHHLHTYIINAPTTATAPRSAPARRRHMCFCCLRNLSIPSINTENIARRRSVLSAVRRFAIPQFRSNLAEF